MRRYLNNMILILILIFLAAWNEAFAADSTYQYPKDEYYRQQNTSCSRPVNMIATNPVRYLDFYEMMYLRKVSCFGVAGIEVMAPSESEITGWGAAIEYRHYFFHKAFPGFYLAPRVAYHDLKHEATKKEKSFFTAAFIGGWQFIFSERWALGAGFGIEILGKVDESQPEYDNYSGTAPFIRLELGVVW